MTFLRRRWEKNWPELSAAVRGGCPAFVFSHRPPELGSAVPVFAYHSVEPARFEADLRFLQLNGYVTIGADALLDHLLERRPAPERAVVLSFDDGAANLHRVVFPLLRAYAQTAVAFISPHFHFNSLRLPADATARPCTPAEIREMHASGLVDFQSHTLEHRYVPRWPEAAPLAGIAPRFTRFRDRAFALADDLRLSREMLEAELHKRVLHLAFPRYDGTPEAVRIGRGCGYRAFWWGLQPGQPENRPGDDASYVVRLSGEFLRRLPGRGRAPLSSILGQRYAQALGRWRNRASAAASGYGEGAVVE
jgi:peptidoglycan/xylan/chitin deacetylase (PgdA/CDA1 family)